jgi:hypothetical protein
MAYNRGIPLIVGAIMRFIQLLILIVLCCLALLTNAQTGPNYQATRTAIAERTSGTHIVATRNFSTPAQYHLTVTAQAADATGTALAINARTIIPTMDAQSLSDEEFDLTSTAIVSGDSSSASSESNLVIALLFFGGLLVGLAILGGLFYMMNQGEKGR